MEIAFVLVGLVIGALLFAMPAGCGSDCAHSRSLGGTPTVPPPKRQCWHLGQNRSNDRVICKDVPAGPGLGPPPRP